jgi:para-nitrobenzyl esterase
MKNTLFLFLFFCSIIVSGQKNIIKTESGLIEGTTNLKGDIQIFKGIPFAAPPVGKLRWKAPQPVEKWKDVKKCVAFGASPMQDSPKPFMFWSSEFLIPKEPIAEDCLYLNVWSGAKVKTEKRPVFVYIYGGGFRSGGAGCPIYDGEAMAKKGVVFITINYRVGTFGFLVHPELSKETNQQTSGNYALLDMIAALQWIQKNITSFGGDPKNVTIAGQSAGAFAVNYLTATPLAKGLFHRAIAESGGSFSNRSALNKINAEQQGVDFAKKLNCNSLAELREKSAEDIMKASGGMSSPIIDGYVMPESIYDIFSKGKQNDVATIVGWNKEDVLSLPKPIKKAVFKEQIQKRFGALSEDFLKAYDSNTDEEAAQSQSEITRDEFFGYQDYTWAKMQNKTGKAKVYMYNFNRKIPAHSPETQFGAFHTGEVPYAYNNLHTVNRPFEAIDFIIADKMSNYWVNFAKTGNPNGDNLPKWEPYNVGNEPVIMIDTTIESKTLPSKNKMLFWEKYFAISNGKK